MISVCNVSNVCRLVSKWNAAIEAFRSSESINPSSNWHRSCSSSLLWCAWVNRACRILKPGTAPMKLETRLEADLATRPPSELGSSWKSFNARAKQAILAILYDVKPPRHRQLPAMMKRWLAYGLASSDAKSRPPLDQSPIGSDGLLGFSNNMRVDVLRTMYANGAFPMTHHGPVRWYAPPNRAVLKISDFRPRSELKRKLRKQLFRVTFDEAPRDVMKACAEPRPGQWPLTWITPDVVEAYDALHRAGDMHSVEVWDNEGRLVGGLFGTSVGPVFVIESLFHRASNASKYGLAALMAHLQAWGFQFVDYKTMNPHIASLGFSDMPLPDYLAVLENTSGVAAPTGCWRLNAALDLGKWKPADGPPPLRTT